MENPIEMDDLGVPIILETSISHLEKRKLIDSKYAWGNVSGICFCFPYQGHLQHETGTLPPTSKPKLQNNGSPVPMSSGLSWKAF